MHAYTIMILNHITNVTNTLGYVCILHVYTYSITLRTKQCIKYN